MFLCFLLLSTAFYHQPALAQTSTASQSSSVPFIGGGYQFVYSYNEIRGDVGIENACSKAATFPYQLTWLIDIYQVHNSPAIRFCVSGTDCSEVYWDSVLVQASPLARQVFVKRVTVYTFQWSHKAFFCRKIVNLHLTLLFLEQT